MVKSAPPVLRTESVVSEPSVRVSSATSAVRRAASPGARALHPRPSLSSLGLPPGKRARLKRLLYDYGPGGGTLLVLPIDQGLEHGPVDFFENPAALDPDYQFRLAREG